MPGGKIMSKDAQPALAMPDRLVPMADLDRARPGPATGAPTPQALELRHLRYFVALADAGNFTRAAEKIFIAQPTLSQQIRRLEEIVGTPLLQRRREGLRLTPAGRVLLDESRNVLALADQAVNRTRQAAGLGRPRLRVVMPPGLADGQAGDRACGARGDDRGRVRAGGVDPGYSCRGPLWHHQPGGTGRAAGHPRSAPRAPGYLRRLGRGHAGRRPTLRV